MDLRKPSFRRTSMLRSSASLLLSAVGFAGTALAQAPSAEPTTSNPPVAAAPSNVAAVPTKPWIVRDPATGRVFQQQLVPVTVPVTRWEAKTIDQTVYEPQVATNLQPYAQTTLVPKTDYVMQPKLRGWWNPLKQPTQTYEYVPKTTWVPQTQQIAKTVVTQNWVPKQQKIVVYQPVQTTEVRQQLVQTELPQPPGTVPTSLASAPRQPFFRLPILAQQRVLPWQQTGQSSAYPAPYPAAIAPSTQLAQSTAIPPTVAQANVAAAPAPQTPNFPATQPAPAAQPVYPPTAPPQYAAAPVLPPPQYASSGLRPVVPTAPFIPLPASPRVPTPLRCKR